ncbi:MAG: ATP-binding protein [Bacteroidales bacterium]|nr:ATP-binding protein [Bacteroidales bacterium]
MTVSKNPFVFGKIVDEDHFCNRVQEMHDLQQNVHNGYSTWLFAPRRYGKSSLIKQVFKRTSDVKTIYFDLYNIETIDDFARKYSNVLSKELFNWKDDIKSLTSSIKSYFENLSPQISFDENALPTLSLQKQQLNKQSDLETILSIPEKIAQQKNISICIAFDEFQEISRVNSFIIHWMRSKFQNQQRVSYIFLGSKQSLMEDIFTNINSPFYEYALKMNIKPIAREELFKYIRNKFEENTILIEDDLIDTIIDKSGGHPHYTQYFASVIFDMLKAEPNIKKEELIEKWINKIIDSQSVIFQNIYDDLSNNQRKVLWAIAMQPEELFSTTTRNALKLPPASSITSSISTLLKKDLIEKVEKSYKVSSPVFKEWLIRL